MRQPGSSEKSAKKCLRGDKYVFEYVLKRKKMSTIDIFFRFGICAIVTNMAEDSKKLEGMIEDLAISVAGGFSSMDKRFNNVESDLKSFKTETRADFDKLNEKID